MRCRVLVLCCVALTANVALADEGDVLAVARVVVEQSDMRSGPGFEFRAVGVARRGQAFRVVDRSSKGYWFQVERPEGTQAWIAGEALFIQTADELSDDEQPYSSSFFAPPPLYASRGEISLTGGVLGHGGLVSLRPSLLVHPTLGFELNLSASASSGGQLYLLGGGPIINLFPDWPVVPFVGLGGGALIASPNADSFLFQSGVRAGMYGAGGLRINFRGGMSLRMEYRSHVFYNANAITTQKEISGGVCVFF